MNPLFLLLLMSTTALTPPPPPPAAPVVTSADMQLPASDTPASTFSYDPSLITIGGNRVFTMSANSNSPTLSSAAGATDDTSSPLASVVNTQPKLYLREWTVVSTLDATWTLTFSGACRAAALGFVVSGLDSIVTPAGKSGSGPTLPNNDAVVVTGGPRNVTVVDFMAIRGSHATNPPTAPAGFTLLDVVGAIGTNNPTDTNRCTLAAAVRTYEVADLTWTGDEATIPAASFGGLADIGTIVWVTQRMVLLS